MASEVSVVSEAKRAKKDLNQILIEQLKCYACKNGVKAGKHRWYTCSLAHKICQECKEIKHMIRCPCSLTNIVSSEYCKMTEALLTADKMQFECENLSRGCQVKLGEENMIYHQAECIHRLVTCPQINCLSKVPFHELLGHMRIVAPFGPSHGQVVKHSGDLGKIIEGPTQDKMPDFFMTFGFHFNPKEIDISEVGTFVVVGQADAHVLYHWIYFVGSAHEAKNFYYTFEYKNREKTPQGAFCSYSNQVIPIDESASSIIENGKCIGIPRKLLFKQFVQENGLFEFSVKIRNLKEEAKDDNVESGISDNDD